MRGQIFGCNGQLRLSKQSSLQEVQLDEILGVATTEEEPVYYYYKYYWYYCTIIASSKQSD